MKDAIIRVDVPALSRSHYVKNVSHNGGFSVTMLRERARRFTLRTAHATIARLANTRMQFSVCDAPEAGDA